MVDEKVLVQLEYKIIDLKKVSDNEINCKIEYYCPRCEENHFGEWNFFSEVFNNGAFEQIISEGISSHVSVPKIVTTIGELNDLKESGFGLINLSLEPNIANSFSGKFKKLSELK